MSDLAAKKLPPIDLDDFERRLRHGPQHAQHYADPLSELARLVEMDDPFKGMFTNAEAKDEVSKHGAYSPQVQEAGSYGATNEPGGNIAEPGYAEMAWREAVAKQQADNTVNFRSAESDDSRSATRDDFNAQWSHQNTAIAGSDKLAAYSKATPMSRRFPRKSVIAGVSLSVVALAGVAAAIGFRGLPNARSQQDLPVIRAAVGPAKVQPPQSTNETAAATSVLDKAGPGDNTANVKVVSREEQPIDTMPVAKVVKTVQTAGAGASATGLATAPTPSPVLATMPEPKRVKTVLVRPDGSIVGEPGVQSAPSQAIIANNSRDSGLTPTPKIPDLKAPPAKIPEEIAQVIKPVPAQVAQTAPVKATSRIVPAAPARPQKVADATTIGNELVATPLQLTPAPQPSGKPVKIAARDAAAVPGDTTQATGSTGGGSFAVQLAAPGSEQEAKDTTARLQKQFAAALGNYQPSVRKAADKEVYRVRVGNLSKDEADALCGKLKSAGGACFIARN